MTAPLSTQRGTIALDLSDEFDDLELLYIAAEGGEQRTPRELKQTVREVTDRFRVAHAPALRYKRTPSAYRAFYRQLGVDPDVVRSPLDVALLDRLRQGRFRPRGLVHDSMLMASIETQVPLWALDGSDHVGGLGIRGAEDGETLGGDLLANGRLVIADSLRPRAALLHPVPEESAVTKKSQVTVVFCLRVPGVPRYVIEEALHLCAKGFAFR